MIPVRNAVIIKAERIRFSKPFRDFLYDKQNALPDLAAVTHSPFGQSWAGADHSVPGNPLPSQIFFEKCVESQIFKDAAFDRPDGMQAVAEDIGFLSTLRALS